MMKPMSKHQEKIIAAFDSKNVDIDIAVIYTRVYGDPGHMTAREMQQKLAPIFQDINRRLDGKGVIETGEKKRTYRYTAKG